MSLSEPLISELSCPNYTYEFFNSVSSSHRFVTRRFHSGSSSGTTTYSPNSSNMFFNFSSCALLVASSIGSRHLDPPIPGVTFVFVHAFLIEPNSARSDGRETCHFRSFAVFRGLIGVRVSLEYTFYVTVISVMDC